MNNRTGGHTCLGECGKRSQEEQSVKMCFEKRFKRDSADSFREAAFTVQELRLWTLCLLSFLSINEQ